MEVGMKAYRFIFKTMVLFILIVIDKIYGASALQLDQIVLPDGFTITEFATGIEDARSLAVGPKGTLIVGTRTNGRVWAVVDTNGDYRADRKVVIASGLTNPNGVAFHGDDLYVAERSRIVKFTSIETNLDQPPQPVVIRNDYPTEEQHGWKYIAFGPDGYLYVPVGAPCNICLQSDERFASITRMKPDGSDFSIFAKGIRNTVGFDWHPETKELWFTDNGRDNLGDTIPSDELNRAPGSGMHFGFPFCHAGTISDPQFGSQRSCDEFTPPVVKLGAHVASLGMKFYTGSMFPSKYRNRIFIAEHGSWNSPKKVGYRIVTVDLSVNPPDTELFASGWLRNETAWGRPVDILVMKDGSLLVSDDFAGAVYRIKYTLSTNIKNGFKDRIANENNVVELPSVSLTAKNRIDLQGKLVPKGNNTSPAYRINPVSGKHVLFPQSDKRVR
jgi:glucose/arabinose dehydrogenase